MSSPAWKQLILFGIIALMLPLVAACSNGDDENGDDAESAIETVVDTAEDEATEVADTTPEADPTSEVEASPTTDEARETTPETEATSEPTGTTEVAETPTSTGSTPDTGETPDSAMTPESTPDAAGTAEANGTPDVGSIDDPAIGMDELAAEVPNFTLEYTGNFENVPDDTGETFSADMEMLLQQSEPDIYYLRLITSGDETMEIEMWSLAGSTWIAESGGMPIELPGGVASDLVPIDSLMFVPPADTLDVAEEVGEEEVNGRTTTHYRVDAEQAALLLLSQGVTVTNPEGGMDIWVDEELGIVIQMTADLSFENEDGSDGSFQTNYSVTDIDETADIEAPS